MKNQKGITLLSLVIYIIVMIVVIGVIHSIVQNFQNNMHSVQADTQDIIKFSRFNTYFLKEVKLNGNSVDTIQLEKKEDEIEKYIILFTSGNSFAFYDKKIYYNDTELCNGVQDVNFSFRKYTNEDNKEVENKNVIDVSITFENFSKSMSYKVEEIY